MARTFYEFFAGGGMARTGLGPDWTCLFANDIDAKKAATYAANWGKGSIRVADIGALTTKDLPGRADLAWASFPCQDLSLAGNGAGLDGARSGTFWSFWTLMNGLKAARRLPRIIALENVVGLLTSHGGKDFAEVTRALAVLGCKVGAMVIDAERFVPQSRPRVFFVAVRGDAADALPGDRDEPTARCTPHSLRRAVDGLDAHTRRQWRWWRLTEPPARNTTLSSLIEPEPTGVDWHSPAQTAHILGLMSEVNKLKLVAAQAGGRRVIGTVYRRTRPHGGGKAQRAEVRFDDVSGCLRTPAGGSSRQIIMVVEGERVRTRLLSPREAARLMGLPDEYRLPGKYNEAYHLLGDGVVASVVGYLGAEFDWAELDMQSKLVSTNAKICGGNGREIRTAFAENNTGGGSQIGKSASDLQIRTTKILKPEMLSLRESTIFEGDALTVLQRLPSDSVQCAVTSPPYWGLRDYDIPDQIGLEKSLPQFINSMRTVCNELRRVLRGDGVFWLNIGDGYTSGNRGWRAPDKKNRARAMDVRPDTPDGLKPKDLLGIPWRLAFALQEDGWYLRADIVWNKPNAMPESVKDRPTRAHEYVFMFTKDERYYYDREAILDPNGRNCRSVWNVNTQGFSGAHFATFPPKLIEPCIKSSSRPRDFVLDPFFGSGTVGVVAAGLGRRFVGIELNPKYVALAADRVGLDEPKVVRIAA